METKESKICNTAISILQKLMDDTKCKNELELKNKYKNELNLILNTPIIVNMPIVLYRSRLASKVHEDITLPSTFSYFPLTKSSNGVPQRGRMNLSGQSFFYASSSPDTNYKEIKKDIKEGDEVYLSQWGITANSGLSIYSVILPDNISTSADKNTCICITNPNIANGPLGDYLRCLSDIILKNEDDANKEYLASSIISNEILVETKGKSYKEKDGVETQFHYDAIAYPSTRIGNGEAQYYNLVITPQFIDNYASLNYVVKGAIKKDLQSIDVKNVGFNHNGTIEWYEPFINVDDVIFNPIGFIDKYGKFLSIENGIVRDLNGKLISKNELQNFLNKEETNIIKEFTERGFIIPKFSYGGIIDKESLIKEDTLDFFREVNEWKLERDRIIHDITFLKIEMMYKISLKKENINSLYCHEE
ncbi:hypothetical protein [Phocaeicola plebeius]